jgi:translation elongation factor EF-Ts
LLSKNEMIEKLREETKFNLLECEIALQNNNWGYEKALFYLSAKDILFVLGYKTSD